MRYPLYVDQLAKIFKSGSTLFGTRKTFTAVDSISFHLKDGEILGFLGPNGAGKTTTIQMLLGLLTPTAGSISYFGMDLQKYRSDILRLVTFCSGYDKLPARMTIWENLDIIGRLYSIPSDERQQRIKDLLEFFNLWERRNKQVGLLSAGQTTAVLLAKAFLPNSKIILLDEPTAALDPDVAQEVRSFILEQCKQREISILFTSHNMDEVSQLCDRVLIIKDGRIIADNTPEQLAATVSRARIYLMITQGLDTLIRLAQQQQIIYAQQEHDIILEVDEKEISRLLVGLAKQGIEYSQISIDKPTLEDYFLSMSLSLN